MITIPLMLYLIKINLIYRNFPLKNKFNVAVIVMMSCSHCSGDVMRGDVMSDDVM